MKKGLLTLISGSSGVGKNTVIDKLVNKHKDYILLRSSTTRARRVDDKIQKDGKEVYNFLTKEEFESKISAGEMLEYDIFSGNYYGVSKGSIEEALKDYPFVLKDITVKGAINSQVELSGKVNITTIFLTLRKSLLKKRLIRRQTKDIKARMKHYKFEQLSIPLYEYCIENKELNRTLAQIEAILKMEYDNNYLMLFENIEKYSDKKVQKIEEKLKANKNVPYIQVAEKDGVIYIVKGLNTYLASVRTGINVTKIFVETKDFEVMDQKQWLEILEEYKNK